MAFKAFLARSSVGKYGEVIRKTPREVIYNRHLISTSILFALCGIPLTWDQGTTSSIATLPGFQDHFGISSTAAQISNYVSLVYIGAGVGSALSFFINDRIGRLWSYRLYSIIWIIGQMIAIAAPNLDCLYAARVVAGFGIGPLTVIGPMSLAEIAPTEIRGLISSLFTVGLLLGLFASSTSVLGVHANIPSGRIQYQVVWLSPCVFVFLCLVASFWVCESPRWFFLQGRDEEGIETLKKLRGLQVDHPRLELEIREIQKSIAAEKQEYDGVGQFAHLKSMLRETFLVPANLRRLQQAVISYAFAQLSGSNLVTSYFIPILKLMGVVTDTQINQGLFINCMYSMAKFFFTIIAAFFFIDVFGRRNSLFFGITLQMVSELIVGVYVKYHQQQDVSPGFSKAALAFIFIHAFGWTVGLLILPYVFVGEIWPNRIRSFGAALTQCFHWLFYYAMSFAMPNILSSMDNWGAFIFFSGWCFLALIYVYLMVPEIAGLSMEEVDNLFKGSWFNAYKRSKERTIVGRTAGEVTSEDRISYAMKGDSMSKPIDEERP